jgi:hypothetical protein
VDGEAIRFGGQIANKIGMVLTGKAHDFGEPAPALEACANHCCRSPLHPDFLAILDPGEACSLLDDLAHPGQHWTEAFPAPLAAGAPSGLASTPPGVAVPGGSLLPASLASGPAALAAEAPADVPAGLEAAARRFVPGLSRRS